MKPPVVLSFTASLVKLYPIYQGGSPIINYRDIPVILQVACALAALLGPSLGLAPAGPL